MKKEIFKSFDGTELVCQLWDEVEAPKAVVQLSHGMAEHIERYDAFAQYLNKNGFIVFGDNHRAHGETAGDHVGYQDGNIFEDTAQDLIAITKMLKEKYNLPVVLLGHSYGSFLSQRYLELNGEAVGVILSGSAKMSGLLPAVGKMVANMIYSEKNAKEPGKTMDTLSFGSYNKPFKDDGEFAWLSRDLENNKKYVADPLSGMVMSNAFFKYFMDGLANMYKKENLALVKKDSKIRIFSGSKDPVGSNGKSPVALCDMYKALGIADVQVKLYEDARHEILNEINKEEVYKDMLDAINYFLA
ncbi:MAG: alpha/beta hydrolase [Clostridia bacterium]|nr:alpha/beta hydrolase [Clostridia bacterium]